MIEGEKIARVIEADPSQGAGAFDLRLHVEAVDLAGHL